MSNRTFTRDDLEVRHPIDYIASNVSTFFPRGYFHPSEAIGLLTVEALRCGVDHLAVEHCGEWWIVRANKDWITEPDKLRPFRVVTPYRQGGDNSMRAEVLLTAFCRSVTTATKEGVVNVRGEPFKDIWRYLPDIGDGRVLAFRP